MFWMQTMPPILLLTFVKRMTPLGKSHLDPEDQKAALVRTNALIA